MRTIVIVAGLACIALAGCEQSKSEAAAVPAEPVVKKSLGRMRPLYAGQEQILSVADAKLEVDRGALVLKVSGQAPGAGYTDAAFVPRIYPAAPKDGIYEVDVVATKPGDAGAQAATPIEIERAWEGYPKQRLKGVTFITKTNQVTAMLPAAEGAGGGS